MSKFRVCSKRSQATLGRMLLATGPASFMACVRVFNVSGWGFQGYVGFRVMMLEIPTPKPIAVHPIGPRIPRNVRPSSAFSFTKFKFQEGPKRRTHRHIAMDAIGRPKQPEDVKAPTASCCSACPDGPNCIGPGGTVFTSMRLGRFCGIEGCLFGLLSPKPTLNSTLNCFKALGLGCGVGDAGLCGIMALRFVGRGATCKPQPPTKQVN